MRNSITSINPEKTPEKVIKKDQNRGLHKKAK